MLTASLLGGNTVLGTPSPESLLSGNGPSSHPDTLVHHFGVISNYVPFTSTLLYISSANSVHSAFKACSNMNQFFPHSPLPLQSIFTSDQYEVPLLPLLCPYNLFSLKGLKQKYHPLFQILQWCLVGFRIKFMFKFMLWPVKFYVIWLPVTTPVSLPIPAFLTVFNPSGLHALPRALKHIPTSDLPHLQQSF